MNWTRRLDINRQLMWLTLIIKTDPTAIKNQFLHIVWKQVIKNFIWLPSIKIKRDGLLHKATKEGV